MGIDISGKGFTKNRISEIFKKMDINSDSEINESEFKDLFSTMFSDGASGGKSRVSSVDANTFFTETDKDQSGGISKDELDQLFEGEGRKKTPPPPPLSMTPSSSNASSVFSDIDTNKDGVISQVELMRYFSGLQTDPSAETSTNSESDDTTNTVQSSDA
jgi:hypothetical protein